MKKTSFLLTLSLFALILAPINNLGAQPVPISTGLTRDVGNGAAPIIKAKWEMNGPYVNLLGTDDAADTGAQFNAPGLWGATMEYSICAVVTDPDGMADINAVYADIFYPEDKAFHPMDPDRPDQIDGGTLANQDYGLSGCGFQRSDEYRLTQLSKTDGYNLFCDNIKNNNENLPNFYDQYNYNEICDPDGELMKETAYVYCADAELIWEDPAGDYRVMAFALDNAGVFSNQAENNFTYLPLTSYEVDFDSVGYGNVKLNTHKRISGDLVFGTADKPTVRNTGNTRLYMGVVQDDMNLGTTDNQWNVQYDARVGNNEEDWIDFDPEQHVWLEDILDLSETEEMDFSILVHKFPLEVSSYQGDMTLDAQFAQFRQCDGDPDPTGADLSLTKTVLPTSLNTGENATYTITVSNAGPENATNVTVEDILPAGVTYVSDDGGGAYNTGNGIWTIGTINAGNSVSLNIIVTVNQEGPIENIAQVETSDQDDPDSTPGNNVPNEDDQDSATITVSTPAAIDLSLTKSVDPTSVPVGATTTFTLTVSNAGPDEATGVSVEEVLPAGITYASDNGGGDYNTGTNIWTIGSIANGVSVELQIVATVDQQGDIVNTAQVETANEDDSDSTPGNDEDNEDDQDSTTVHGLMADLELDKTVNVDTATPGEFVFFTVTVTNKGPDVATDIEVNEVLPDGLPFVSANVTHGSYNSGTGIWTIPSIAVNTIARIDVTVDTTNANGSYTNKSEVTAAGLPDPDSTPGNASTTPEDDDDSATVTIPPPTP